MTDPKIPQPALFSETLEKARRNSLVWSALAIGAELAQAKDHTLKSSILGGDTGLPVAMVAFIFIALSAFHFVAFWFEKNRIQRWRSRYAAEHEGPDLNDRIQSLLLKIENQFVDIDDIYRKSIRHLNSLKSNLGRLSDNYSAFDAHAAKLNDRYSDFYDEYRKGEYNSEKIKTLFLALPSETRTPIENNIDFHDFSRDLIALLELHNVTPGPTEVHLNLLIDVTSKLKKLSEDISSSEQLYFLWYEISMPVVALTAASWLWVSATIYPDIPLLIRGVFVRT